MPPKKQFSFDGFSSQNNCLLLILDGQALGKTWVPLSIIQVQRSDKMLQSTNNISIEELVPILIQGTLDAFAIVRLLFGLRFQYFPTNHAALHSYNSFSNRRGRNMKTRQQIIISEIKRLWTKRNGKCSEVAEALVLFWCLSNERIKMGIMWKYRPG